MRDAISLLDQVISFSEGTIKIEDVHDMNGTVSQKELKNFVNNILKNNYKEIFLAIDKYNDEGKNLIKLTDELIYFIRNVLMYKMVPEYFSNNDAILYEDLSKLAEKSEFITMIEKFNNSTYKMKISNNPKIVLETTIISLSKNNEIEKKTIKQNEKSIVKIIEKEEKQEKDIITSVENTETKINNQILNSDIENKLIELENIRINNTLSQFDKNELFKLKQKFDDFRTYILNPDYGDLISLILEGQLRAASQTHLVMVFEEYWMKNKFNSLIKDIEVLFEKIYKKKYCVVATDIKTWEIYKNDFNNKRKTFKYTKEPSVDDIISISTPKTKIENTFDSIIEYH